MTGRTPRRGDTGPTRRDLLKGTLALAGAGLAGAAPAFAAAPHRLVLTVNAKGVFGAEAVLAQAAPLLAREGRSGREVDLLVAEGYRPAGFRGAVVSPDALVRLPADRIAAMLADPLTAQITAPPATRPLPPGVILDRLAALLSRAPERSLVVVALPGRAELTREDHSRFEAALAPSTRIVSA